MLQEEILERNKEIVLMLGLNHDEEAFVFDGQAYSWDLPRFQSDYNWLMEVVEFINNLKIKQQTFYVSITRSNVWVYQYKNETNICPASASGVLPENEYKPLKETLFLAVSDFAKLYNNKEL
jgi:hypothetical protein